MKRYDDPNYGGYPMGPEWGRPHPMDPNWSDGTYRGARMGWSHHQGGYGYHRQMREQDLMGHGGFDGIYDEGPGRYNAEGQFEHPYFYGHMQHPRSRPLRHGYDAGMRFVQDGGVRGDTRYLRQYNAHSPALRGPYDRGYGWAPAGPHEGGFRPDPRGHETEEHRYAGYNRGGFAPERGPASQNPGRRR